MLSRALGLLLAASAADGRVVGYVPDYRVDSLQSIDYTAVTHLVASFLDPGSDDKFVATQELRQIINKAHAEQVQAFVAIGGGGADVDHWKQLMQAGNAESTAQKIVAAAVDLGADGVDVDLEGDLVLVETYNSFVATLHKAVKAQNLGLSAALAQWTASQAITDDTLNLFDFVNLMCYDYKGPWDVKPPLQHAPYSAAEEELNYYINNRSLPGDRVVLGVPFYGYDFANTSDVKDFTWAQIVSDYPSELDSDNIGSKYFNGKSTIHKKAQLAKSMGAGVMIWELGQDVAGPDSLLAQIKAAMSATVSV